MADARGLVKSLGSGKPAGPPGIAVEGLPGIQVLQADGDPLRRRWVLGRNLVGGSRNVYMTAVERAEHCIREQEAVETVELRMLASMYAQPMQGETVFIGAA